ncbi:hypothetical protein HOM98_00875 [Candidatus Peregrinibacteria bacterium]|jgi:spore coat protein CotH|nr:hypothetical protein [Candidatus Peregrinibacteria bacterium]MBT7483676.1 hypothetical protein [Candidatus Peregrinibacteria bacterium]
MHIPIKLRRHYKLLVAVVAVFVISITVLGEVRVIPYTVSADTYAQDVESEGNTFGLLGRADSSDFFDEIDVMHEVEIDMDPDDYDMMILTYEETAEKDYFEVDITIDGVLYESVGIRLKGNSSLRGAIGMGMGQGAAVNKVPQEFQENDYETPFMIKFDEYVDQDFMGQTLMSLRAQFNDATAMQEVLSYEILEDMGITAPSIVYGTVSMNGEGERLYMLCEVVNDEFLVEYMGATDGAEGDLFKSGGNGHMIYEGDDPTMYGTYELQTNEGVSDLYDLIEMFKFFDEAEENEFFAQIDEYMDMDVYLDYLAFCNVLVNLDSHAGNGNNYYIYQYPDTEQFVIIPWDLNEAFGRFGMNGDRWQFGLYFEEYKIKQSMGQGGAGGEQQRNGMGPPEDGMMMPPKDGGGMMPINENFEIADLFFDTAFAAAHSNHPRAELVQQQMMPQDGQKGMRPPRNKGNNWPSAPVVFEEDMDLSELSPLMAWVFDTEELNEQYLDAIISLLKDEFAIDKVQTRADELIEFLTTENEERGFWTDKEYERFVTGAEGLKDFVENRHEYLWELLREEIK